MIFYNLYFLKKYQIYLNVEICTLIKFVTYFYKYVFKNFDHVSVFFVIIRKINNDRIHRNDNRKIVNEIIIYHDVWWIDLCEIVWKEFRLFMKKIKYFVIRLQIYMKNQQRILFDFNDDITSFQLQNNKKFRQTILIEFFKMNQRVKDAKNANLSFSHKNLNINKNFKNYIHQNIFKHFVWKTKKKFVFFEKKLNVLNAYFCKIDIIDFVDETLTNVSEMKNVKCNNIYLNMLKLKVDFRKIRKDFVI